MELLLDKIAFLLMPHSFKEIFPYCFWYWLLLTGILIWLLKKK